MENQSISTVVRVGVETDLREEFAVLASDEGCLLWPHHDMGAVKEEVEKATSWKLCLEVNHQLKEALAVVHLGFVNLTWRVCTWTEHDTL